MQVEEESMDSHTGVVNSSPTENIKLSDHRAVILGQQLGKELGVD